MAVSATTDSGSWWGVVVSRLRMNRKNADCVGPNRSPVDGAQAPTGQGCAAPSMSSSREVVLLPQEGSLHWISDSTIAAPPGSLAAFTELPTRFPLAQPFASLHLCFSGSLLLTSAMGSSQSPVSGARRPELPPALPSVVGAETQYANSVTLGFLICTMG